MFFLSNVAKERVNSFNIYNSYIVTILKLLTLGLSLICIDEELLSQMSADKINSSSPESLI